MNSSSHPLAIGIDFGGTSIKSALIQESCILARGRTLNPQTGGGAENTLREIETVVRELCSGLPAAVPVGIGLPGLVDSVNGIVHQLSNVPGWREIPVARILRERLGVPVILENDANAMAYAEWRYGAARNTLHALCITLGTGVGGALILDGKLYRGAQLSAGEVGHTSIDYRGLPGPYGNFGCLESYVGNNAISTRALAAYAAAHLPPPSPECSPRDLSTAAEKGCPVAQSLWEKIGTELGAAFANAVWLLNPDAIVIGGGVANAGAFVFDPLQHSLRSRTSRVIHENLRVVGAALGNDAGAIGCAALALDAVG